LRSTNQSPVPDILNSTFHSVDSQLSALAQAQGTHSGCTAVTAFLRLENANGEPVGRGSGVSEEVFRDHRAPTIAEEHRPVEGAGLVESHKLQTEEIDLKQVIAVAIEEDEASLQGEGVDREQIKPTVPSTIVNPTASLDKKEALASPSIQIPAQVIAAARRTLYTANVGDARAVLS
jgi:protein phosphatase PTC1